MICNPEEQELQSEISILDFVTAGMMLFWGTKGVDHGSWLLKESENRVKEKNLNLANWVNKSLQFLK